MTWRNRVEVSYRALRRNAAAVRAAAGGRTVVAVVKADAYGLGLERCVRIYHEAGVGAFAVAALSEADRVRAAVPEARVILLSSPLPEERPAVVASAYEVCCSGADEVRAFAALASPRAPHPVHVLIDTGMGRFGCGPDEAVAVAAAALADRRLRLAGIATHYPMATAPDLAEAQERLFAGVLAQLPALPKGCLIHVANSEGVLVRPGLLGNAVRCGLLLAGIVPDGCRDPGVEQAMTWVSSLSLVKRLPAGHGVSYNRTRILARDTLAGILPVGYADGYPLALSNRGAVLIRGQRCPVLGRVTMDYCIVDCTDLEAPLVAPGEPVVLCGRQGAEQISVVELARLAGTIPYDILCGLRGRCEVVGVP
ncbi:alanine racemase [Planctomycetota bacterium]|nr:alanine racemase [Planctomycetota bacterium]